MNMFMNVIKVVDGTVYSTNVLSSEPIAGDMGFCQPDNTFYARCLYRVHSPKHGCKQFFTVGYSLNQCMEEATLTPMNKDEAIEFALNTDADPDTIEWYLLGGYEHFHNDAEDETNN